MLLDVYSTSLIDIFFVRFLIHHNFWRLNKKKRVQNIKSIIDYIFKIVKTKFFIEIFHQNSGNISVLERIRFSYQWWWFWYIFLNDDLNNWKFRELLLNIHESFKCEYRENRKIHLKASSYTSFVVQTKTFDIWY